MTPERWRQAKGIFFEALDRAPDARRVWLTDACANDPALQQEVESLLDAHDAADGFIETPAAGHRATTFRDGAGADRLIGRRLGAYRIDRVIGQGGMGIVYRGIRDDGHYRQEVAIKFVAMSLFADLARQRFQQEREILATLKHPYIARLLDAGTSEDGLPYFVMELVDGSPIDAYCEQRGLNVDDRLRLVGCVCDAVQYAHQHLVVHRDLKPTNVLVTPDGVPKLLDFGIAKLLGDGPHDGMTLPIMTPDYASPEQIRGEPVSTTTDVYTLGVLLYRILTGRAPYEPRPDRPHDLARAICDEEPRPPSTVSAHAFRKSLSGDLDAIVLKALCKEPIRRYASVEQLSEDIRRHLGGLPVIARRDTVVYRAGKFVRRHRAASIGAALAMLSLVAGVIATSWQAGVARAERARAERRFNDVRKLANAILFDIHDAIRDLPGSTGARELVLKRALEYLDSLAREAADDAALRYELATAYARVASIQGGYSDANVGDTAAALASYQKALATLGDPRTSQRVDYKKSAAAVHLAVARLTIARGNSAAALTHFREGVLILEELTRSSPGDSAIRGELAAGYKGLGDIASTSGDLQEGLRHYRRVLEIGEAMLAINASDENGRMLVISGYDAVGTLLGNPDFVNLGDTIGALDYLQRLLDFVTTRLRTEPNSAFLLNVRAYTLKSLGEVRTARGDWKQALAHYDEALTLWQRLATTDPRDVRVASRLAYTLSNIGEALAATDRYDEAFDYHRRAIARFTMLSSKDPGNVLFRMSLARSYRKYGDGLMKGDRTTEAIRAYTQAVAIDEPLARNDPADMDIRFALAADYSGLGAALSRTPSAAAKSSTLRTERHREACTRFRQSRDMYLEMRDHKLSTPPLDRSLNNVIENLQRCEASIAQPAPSPSVARVHTAR
jgi:non-specific serine/threonine protein kinase/serine/threonine-protein kinase